jgi:hypothetical protein
MRPRTIATTLAVAAAVLAWSAAGCGAVTGDWEPAQLLLPVTVVLVLAASSALDARMLGGGLEDRS